MMQEAGTRGNKNYFVRLVFSDPFQHGFPVSANKDGLLLLQQGGHLSPGKLYGLFLSRKSGQRAALSFSVFSSTAGEGKGYPLQYSGLENSMDCIVHGVAKSRT